MGCWVWVLGFVALVVIASPSNAVLECSNVVSKFNVCQSYLSGFATPPPSFKCCVAVQSLDKIAYASETDRKAYCECVKKIEKSSFINLDRLELLPQYCRLNVNIGAFTPNADCNKV